MKLKMMPSRIAAAPRRFGPADSTEQALDKHRAEVKPWRGWYKLGRWTKLRMRVFVRDRFTCQRQGCGKLEGNTSKLVADHIEPHRGDPVLFWDEGNVQTLCKPCHDRIKQAEENRARRGGIR